MSRVLIFSDLHIHAHKKSTERLQDCLEVLRWVFEQAKINKIDHILFLGDLFHDRTRLDIMTLHRTHDVFEEVYSQPDAPHLYLLLGNHDMWSRDKWDIYSPKVVSAWDKVVVIDSPRTINIMGYDVDFLPFTENPIVDLANLQSGSKKLLCSHLAIDGAILNSFGIQADVCVEHDGEMVKLDVGFLEAWRRVFLGHYHAPQKVGDRVEYVGSPLQLTYGETGQEKHLVIYDLETDEISYIVNEFSRKHIITTPDKIFNQDIEDHFVMLKVEDLGAAQIADLRKNIHQNHKVASLDVRIIPKIDNDQDVEKMEEAKAILESDDRMLERYIREKGHGELDYKFLLETGIKITESALS